VKDTNLEIWQRSNGRAAMMIFWILTASYVFSGQLIAGVF